jgi:hypothetical protein
MKELAYVLALPRCLAYRVRRSTRFLWRETNRAGLSLGLITFLLCALVSLALGPPPPAFHDEFSYLLAGDTFAHGRMTNPTHPLWQFFESFHVLPRPTYASKYQPAPGLFLAAGQVLFGFPIVGVWLSLGLAAAATGWVLRTWLPPGWSFLGALLLGAGSLVVFRWGDSYWGGGVPLLGGALVLGAAGRLCRRTRAWDGILLALGLILLACSRPFEGILASIPSLVMLAACRWRSRRQPAQGWRRPLLAFAVVASLGAGFMGYYNFRVTGSPWTLPYVAYLREYSYVPPFGWGSIGAQRQYRHVAFERFYREHAEQIFASTSTSSTRWSFKLALVDGYVFRPFVGYSLVLPLLLSLLRPRNPVPLAFATCSLVLAGNVMSLWVFSHYFAAAGAALSLLITVGLRRLMALRRPLGAGLFVVVMVVAVIEGSLRYRAEIDLAKAKRQGWSGMRASLEAELARQPGLDLVVVRYGPLHSIHQEWVYNHADIDASPVIWAREMDAASNRRLFDYFAGRRIWLLDVGPEGFSIEPYPGATGNSGVTPTPEAAGRSEGGPGAPPP